MATQYTTKYKTWFLQVLQGNIEEGDWTSYRLVYPIRTRFIRILPQAWEGNEICTLAEFYTNDHKGILLYVYMVLQKLTFPHIYHFALNQIEDILNNFILTICLFDPLLIAILNRQLILFYF